jgi:hypothetical protein
VVPDVAVLGAVEAVAQVVRVGQVVGVDPFLPVVHPDPLIAVEVVALRLRGHRPVQRHQRVAGLQSVRTAVRAVTQAEQVVWRASHGLAVVQRDADERRVLLGQPRLDQRHDDDAAGLVGRVSEMRDTALPVFDQFEERQRLAGRQCDARFSNKTPEGAVAFHEEDLTA